MAVNNTSDSARLRQLEEGIEKTRIELRALQLAVIGESLTAVGYGWAYTQAVREHYQREYREAELAIAHADLSKESILAAMTTAVSASRHGAVQARDVAIAVMPGVAPSDAPGRQLLIARVGARMRELVEMGKLVRVSAPQGRKTSRYAIAGDVLDAR